MRVPAVGHAFDTMEEVLSKAARSAAVTHNHPEGIKGAQATAAAVFMARRGESKERIKNWLERTFGYNLSERLDELRPRYCFDESCQGTVPAALIAFLESENYEDAVRNAISLGGDADTLACITGAVAEPHYGGVPPDIAAVALTALDDRLRTVVVRFCNSHGIRAA
jgi:ADP-ribosylglycohydrolase